MLLSATQLDACLSFAQLTYEGTCEILKDLNIVHAQVGDASVGSGGWSDSAGGWQQKWQQPGQGIIVPCTMEEPVLATSQKVGLGSDQDITVTIRTLWVPKGTSIHNTAAIYYKGETFEVMGYGETDNGFDERVFLKEVQT